MSPGASRPAGPVGADCWLAGLLLVILLVLTVASMRHLSQTLDEPLHLDYGRRILELDSNRLPRWNDLMPASVLNAIPGKIGAWMGPGKVQRSLLTLSAARYGTIVFSLLVAVFVFRWARALYGSAAGLLALTLYVFDPNILAHSQLATGDVYATGMTTVALYLFWRYLNEGGWRRAIASGLALGLSQLTKYTCVFLYPIFGLIVLGRSAMSWWARPSRSAVRPPGRRILGCVGPVLVFALLSILVINIGFVFNRTFVPLKAYQFRSPAFQTLRPWVRPVEDLRVPVPYPYFDGLDWLMAEERRGKWNIYLFGEFGGKQGRMFPGYYMYASLFKVPIATQLLILWAIVAYVVRFRSFNFGRDEWVLMCPVLVFALYFNFFYRLQIGIRHFLVVFPLLYVFSGSLLKPAESRRPWRKAAIVCLLVYLVISVLSYFPHFLPYFNELVWDRKQAYKILVDSNLDWGQDRWYVDRWLRQHPEAIVRPKQVQAGTIVASANDLVRYERFRWLRENFEPVDHIAYAHLVFRITDEDLRRIGGRRPP